MLEVNRETSPASARIRSGARRTLAVILATGSMPALAACGGSAPVTGAPGGQSGSPLAAVSAGGAGGAGGAGIEATGAGTAASGSSGAGSASAPGGASGSGGGTSAAGRSGGGASAAGSSYGAGSARGASGSGATRSVANGAGSPESRFQSSADAICSDYRHQVSGLTNATGLDAQEQVLPSLLNAIHAALAQLQGLAVPAAEATEFSEFVQDTTTAVNDFVQAQSRTRSTNESSGVSVESQDFSAFQAAGKAAEAAQGAARQLGFHVCGSEGSDWL